LLALHQMIINVPHTIALQPLYPAGTEMGLTSSVGLLVKISLEPCMSYSSSCYHHFHRP